MSTLRNLDSTVCRRPNLRQQLAGAKCWGPPAASSVPVLTSPRPA